MLLHRQLNEPPEGPGGFEKVAIIFILSLFDSNADSSPLLCKMEDGFFCLFYGEFFC